MLSILFLAACSGGHKSSGDSKDNTALGADATASSTPASSPTPAATPTPAETPVPEATIGGPASVITSINTRCRLTDTGADLIVDYSAKVVGATVQRVQLLDNGKVVNDSGTINRNSYMEEYTIKTDPGSRHQLQMQIDSPGGPPRSVQNVAVCPSPAVPPSPRA